MRAKVTADAAIYCKPSEQLLVVHDEVVARLLQSGVLSAQLLRSGRIRRQRCTQRLQLLQRGVALKVDSCELWHEIQIYSEISRSFRSSLTNNRVLLNQLIKKYIYRYRLIELVPIEPFGLIKQK